ncbi:MAG: hypothetical protein H6704_02285 [Myxococcales bacterium]|nr:hypothetical protein [Myxococcales bacterium]MCB9535064.1 hypothetical protein [Myxococcales bacterium]
MRTTAVAPETHRTPTDERAPRMLARAWCRSLRQQGFSDDQIRAFGAEILQMATPPPGLDARR